MNDRVTQRCYVVPALAGIRVKLQTASRRNYGTALNHLNCTSSIRKPWPTATRIAALKQARPEVTVTR